MALFAAKRAPTPAAPLAPDSTVAGKGELSNVLIHLMKGEPVDHQTHQLINRAQQYWNNTTTSLLTKPAVPAVTPALNIAIKLIVAEDVDDAELQRVVHEEEEAKWKRLAEERRQRLKKGGPVVYNKMLMGQVLTKAPVPNTTGFAAGRGKPIKS